MWIFGYGSLVWKADFPYVKKIIGYIKGYERKFWQASIDHRGVPGKPGRVVTLVPSSDPEAKVWGAAYKIHPRDVDHVIKHLDLREVMGYEKIPVEFYPLPHHPLNLSDVETSSSSSLIAESIPTTTNDGASISLETNVPNGWAPGTDEHETEVGDASALKKNITPGSKYDESDRHALLNSHSLSSKEQLNYNLSVQTEEEINQILEGSVPGGHFFVTMYYGNSENEHFIGSAPLEEMASQIYESSGPSGSNKEYLFNLADAMRQICEEAIDPHIAELEIRVRKLDIALNKKKSGNATPIEL